MHRKPKPLTRNKVGNLPYEDDGFDYGPGAGTPFVGNMPLPYPPSNVPYGPHMSMGYTPMQYGGYPVTNYGYGTLPYYYMTAGQYPTATYAQAPQVIVVRRRKHRHKHRHY